MEWQDEGKRGTRPSAPRDQRTGSAYIFSAICPARGAGAALVLPICNSTTMSMQLAEISQAVSPGAHAVLLLDQAGRHTSGKLSVPANVSLVPLPPKSPELNPTENVWQVSARQLAFEPSVRLRGRHRPSSSTAATSGTS